MDRLADNECVENVTKCNLTTHFFSLRFSFSFNILNELHNIRGKIAFIETLSMRREKKMSTTFLKSKLKHNALVVAAMKIQLK